MSDVTSFKPITAMELLTKHFPPEWATYRKGKSHLLLSSDRVACGIDLDQKLNHYTEECDTPSRDVCLRCRKSLAFCEAVEANGE